MRTILFVLALLAMPASAQVGPGHDIPRDGGGGGSGCGPVNPDVPCYGGGGGYQTGCKECVVFDGIVSCDPDGEPNWANCTATTHCESIPGEDPDCEPDCGDRCLTA